MACCIFSLACCAQTKPQGAALADKEDYVQYDTLVRLADLNESAYKYLQYCEPSIAVNPKFAANYKYVMNKLLDRTMALRTLDARGASKQIVQRRTALQASLDNAYQADGCHTAMGDRAAQHYKFFADFTPDRIDQLIREGFNPANAPPSSPTTPGPSVEK